MLWESGIGNIGVRMATCNHWSKSNCPHGGRCDLNLYGGEPSLMTCIKCNENDGSPGWALALFEEFLGRKIEPPKTQPMSEWPLPIRLLARARKAEERGVGDTLQRCLGDTGERFKAAMKRLGFECRCEQRQAYLNVRFPY